MVSKVWDDANNQDGLRPASVTVALYANGEATGTTAVLSADGNWFCIFRQLPAVDGAGAAITYTVAELDVAAGYVAAVTGDAESGFVITNTHVPGTTVVRATKAWAGESEDVGESLRTDVTFHLFGYAEGVVYDAGTKTIELGAAGDAAEATWTVPTHWGGKALTWQIVEVPVFGYTASYEWDANGVSCVVTNTYAEPVTSVTVSKTWVDGDDVDGKRPESVTFQIMRRIGDGEAEPAGEPIVLNEDNGWKMTVSGLPATRLIPGATQDDPGTEVAIQYSVAELDPSGELAAAGYVGCVSAVEPGVFVISNVRTARETVDVTVTKTWADDDNADGIRPAYVNVSVYRTDTGASVGVATLTAENGWTATVSGLPKNASKGVAVEYAVSEAGVPAGYTASVAGSLGEGFVVINTHEASAPLSLVVTKVWAGDESDPSGRADVTLHLLKVVEGYGPIEVEGAEKVIPADATGDALTVAWTDLPSVEDGKNVTYTVREDAVAGYTSSQSDGAVNDSVISITVTNTKVAEPEPETITVTYRDPVSGDVYVNETIVRGESEPAQPTDPERDGYVFGGWDRSEDTDGNVIYEARWIEQPTPGEISVTYVDINGNTIVTTVIVRGGDEPTAPEPPVVENKIFTGWERTTDEDGNVIYAATYIDVPGPVVTETWKLTYLDPKLEAGNMIVSTLNYDSVADADAEAASLSEAPADPEHEGYVFTGWAVNQDEDGDYIIVATYNEVPQTGKIAVSYVDGQGEKTLIQSVLVDPADVDGVVPPAAPSHDGMTFVGWKRTVDAGGNVIYVAEYASDCKNPGPDPEKDTQKQDNPNVEANNQRGGQEKNMPATGDATSDTWVGLAALGGVLVAGAGVALARRRRAA